MATTTVDPTLEQLVPQRSTLRNVAVVAAGLAVLAGLWWAPRAVRPTVVPQNSSGANAPVPGGVLTSVNLAPLDPVTLERVDAVPGARAVRAWVVHDDGTGATRMPDTNLADAAATVAVGSSYDALPAHIEADESTTLLIHWVVDSCAQLVEGYAPTLEVRSVIGLPAHVTLPGMAGPEFNEETTQRSGACR